MDNIGQNSQDWQESWHFLQMEKLRKCSPETYRQYVLYDPIPKEDQAHLDSIKYENSKQRLFTEAKDTDQNYR